MDGCLVCLHPARSRLEADLRGGVDGRLIWHRYGVDGEMVQTHAGHDQLPPEGEIGEQATLSDSLARVFDLSVECGDYRTALTALDRQAAERSRRAKAEAAREREQWSDAASFTKHPLWLDIKSRILAALEPYPEAYKALLGALDV